MALIIYSIINRKRGKYTNTQQRGRQVERGGEREDGGEREKKTERDNRGELKLLNYI